MTRPFHILIVEDNEGDVLLIQEALQQWSIDVKTSVVGDGGDAIDFLGKSGIYQNAEVPDIILLDVNLPKVNGHEVLKYIKGTLANVQIPVIILSTSSSKNDIDLAYKNYANCYISKPAEVDRFFEIFSAIEGFWVNCARLPLYRKS